MAKQLEIKHDGNTYVLEFTRRTVAEMERKGFIVSEIETKPMTALPALFAGAFLANHRFVKQNVIDAVFETIKNRMELINKLAEMYNEPLMTLLNDPEESEGNASWTTNW